MIDSDDKEQRKMVEVYRASGEIEARFIQSLLEDNGIPSLLKGNAAPSVHMFAVDGMAETAVMVWESTAARARALIEGKRDV